MDPETLKLHARLLALPLYSVTAFNCLGEDGFEDFVK
jgi:hypothetical protein